MYSRVVKLGMRRDDKVENMWVDSLEREQAVLIISVGGEVDGGGGGLDSGEGDPCVTNQH